MDCVEMAASKHFHTKNLLTFGEGSQPLFLIEKTIVDRSFAVVIKNVALLSAGVLACLLYYLVDGLGGSKMPCELLLIDLRLD